MDDPVERPRATPSSGFELNRPTIVALLYLAGFFTVFTPIVGVVLCYIWRGEPHEPWEATHYSYHMRTFWVGLIVGMIGFVALILFIGVLVLIPLTIWIAVRAVVSLIQAQHRQPMSRPKTLLF